MVYYYKNKLPAIDDIVIARVENISEYGVLVSLIEYNDIKGFINCGEISRKKRVNMNKILTVGKDVLLHVIQINPEKMAIDLSKRSIDDEEIKIFSLKHKLHIQLYNIFKQLYMSINSINSHEKLSNDNVYNWMCKTLFNIQIDFDNEYILEKLLCKDTNLEIIESIEYDGLITIENLNITQELFKKILDEYIDEKINRIKPELSENIKLMTYSSTGLADIKYSLDFKNFELYSDLSIDFDIEINYLTSSVYSINIIQKDFELKSTNTIECAMNLIKQEIKNRVQEKQIQNQIIL